MRLNDLTEPFTPTAAKITDGRKCQRSLQTDDLNIHVRRTKPTARIYHGSKEGQVARVRQDQDVSIPLRLTGEGVSCCILQSRQH